MRFKEEINDISIPKNLHHSVKKGIEQADQQKQTKRITPVLLTTIVTAALLFVALLVQQDGAIVQASSTYSSTRMIYIFASIITVFIMFFSFVLYVKTKNKRIFLVMICLLSINWNVAIQQSYQLHALYVLPMIANADDDVVAISYLKNKEDDVEIESVTINGKTYNNLFSDGYPLVEENQTSRYHVVQSKILYLKGQTLKDVLNNQTNQATIHFSNGETYIWDMRYIALKQQLTAYLDQQTFSLSKNKKEVVVDYQFTAKQSLHNISWDIPQAYFQNVRATISYNNQLIYDEILTKASYIPLTNLKEADSISITLIAVQPSTYAFLYEDYMKLQTNEGEIPLLIERVEFDQYLQSIKAIQIRQQEGVVK